MNAEHNQATREVVVVALDGSKGAEFVLGAALDYVRARPLADLHLLHVVAELPVADTEMFSREAIEQGPLGDARAMMRGHAAQATAALQRPVSTHVTLGKPSRAIVELAAELEADLVIVGTHDYSALKRLVLGSVAEQVLRTSHCPVLVVRPKSYNDAVPQIEPPCPDCVTAQKASGGAAQWCARHSEHHPRARLHYERSGGFANGSMLVRPEG
jgi:nucleotide-binding universal stress UspA family protein